MTILIPSIGSCTSRMSSSERRLAERLEQKLDDDYLLWYDVPVGPRRSHPNFMVMHPRRGLLILEVRDWSAKNIHRASEQSWQLFSDRMLSTRPNPAGVARQHAQEVVDALMRDPQLVERDGRTQQDKLRFPWSWGVAFPNLTRAEFAQGQLERFIEPQRVLCSDEMLETVEPRELQSRLWDMFPLMMGGLMTPALLERVRWRLFPELRLQQGAPFDDDDASASLPERLRVLDLPQERLMRGLGDGHRVIHGVAGSGKTLLLAYRAELLAKAHTPDPKPILILCYNEPLAVMLAAQMQAKGLGSRVQARHFHKWCREQLVAFGQELPAPNMPVGAKMDEMVQRVIRAVEAEQIPAGQYQAILIDEGHDFAPEWLKLITRMVDPATNSLLLMYDDAQSIYGRSSKQFSFKSVGIQAQGRTSILKVNHRNTRQILHTASLIAADLLADDAQDEDGIALVQPVSCGREGPETVIVRLQTFREEAFKLAELLSAAHQDGHAWGDMAILCRHVWMRDECAGVLQLRELPHEARTGTGTFDPGADSIKLLTMHACKGLEFPIVALPGVGHMPGPEENAQEEARLFYVAATRATERLFITVSRTGAFGRKLVSDK
jgi:hypothetical protein